MERDQELEWEKAQSIEITTDLVSAAKFHLNFLAAVDRNRWLYEGPGLERAIYRYNACWLPLLAKHCESPLIEGPLVIPLDCEWIWHCHRLNPIRYKRDCEELFGRILDSGSVASSLHNRPMASSEEFWRTHFPLESYELELPSSYQDSKPVEKVAVEKCSDYDLVSAVQRQVPFFYQVSRPYMADARFIKEAVARYKGFLHLIRKNKEKGVNSFSVPTYDIDLIWHTHQLHPVSYCNDLMSTMGMVLEHDDTDPDRSKGQKLDVGFSVTTATYEEMYGRRYWRAGAMYRGSAPSPVRTSPYSGIVADERNTLFSDDNWKTVFPDVKVFEVMLEIISVRNQPDGLLLLHKGGSLMVSFSKTQPDAIFNVKGNLAIFSVTGKKQVASFRCQPAGNLILE
ncbi:hypothetical protein M569_10005, partial [Genlisea aurea]